MSINNFIGEIRKGLRAPVYLLYGESHFLLKEAVFLTSGLIPEGKKDFSLNIFDMEEGDKPSIDNIIDILNTMPFFDNRRYVIIENIQCMKKKEIQALTEYISNPSPYSVLVMLHWGKLKDDLKGLSQKVRSFLVDIRPQDIPAWIREKARQKNIDLTDGAIDYLIGITGQDIGLISSEIEKIALLDKRQVDANDISAISKDESDYDVFDLIEAIKRKDRPDTFRILKRILDSAESYNILGALNWYFDRLKEDNKSIDLDWVFSLLHEADSASKHSGGRYPLEYLLIKLLQP